MTDIATISALPIGAFFGDKPPLTYRDGKPILTINGVEHDAAELLRKFASRETMWGEVVKDDYEDIVFMLCEEDNRDGHHFLGHITLVADTFPLGTKISIREPSAALQEPRHDR